MPIAIDIKDAPRELRGAVLAMREANRTVLLDVYGRMYATMSPEWEKEVPQHLHGVPQEKMLVLGDRIKPGNPPILVAADSTSKVGRGLVPTIHWVAFEYGAANHKPKTYYRANRKSSGRHKVTRDTHAGLPIRHRNGWVIGPAFVAIAPRIAAFYVQSVIRAFLDAAESKG